MHEQIKAADSSALNEREAQRRILFSAMREAFLIADVITDASGQPTDYRIVEANPALALQTGLPLERLIGSTATDLHPALDKFWVQSFGRVALSGEAAQWDEYVSHQDRHYQISVHQLRPARFAAIFLDISQQKRAEAHLRESEARFHSVLQYSRDVMYRFNLQTSRYEYISPAAEQVVGSPVEELVAQGGAMDLIHPDDRKAVQEARAHLNETGTTGVEYRQRFKGGGYRWLSNHMSLTRDSEGRPLYRNGNIRDITAHKQTEERLAEARVRAEHMAVQLRTVVESMSERVYACDPTGRTILTNEAYRAYHAGSEPPSYPQSLMDVADIFDLSGRLLPVSEWPLSRALRGEQLCGTELRVHFKQTGQDVIVSYCASPVFDSDGKLIMAVATSTDVTARKQAETERRRVEEQFRRVVDHINDALLVDDVAGNLVFCNNRFLSLFGIDPARMYSIAIEDYVAPEWQSESRSRHERRIRGESVPTHFEYEGIRQNGERIWLEADVVPVKAPDGTLIGTQSVIRDITGRKQAEQALQESEQRYRALVDLAPDAVVVHQDEIILYANAAGLRLFGAATLSQLQGRNVIELIHPDDRDIVRKRARMVQGGGGISPIRETSILQLDGTEVAAEATATSIEWQGRPAVQVIMRDISERKRAEEALRNSERLYRAIGESIDYGVWMCDPEGRNIYTSESFLKLVGLTQQQCSDFGWGNALHPDEVESTVAAWQECVRTAGKWDTEHRFRGVDGQWHFILARGVPVRDDHGQIVCWAGINLDISRLKQAEQALLRSEKLASLGRMAATIAHEINNPLAAAMNTLYLAKSRKDLPPAAREYLETADAELKRIAHITRQSLGFYRESNAPTLTTINSVVESAVDLMESKIKSKKAIVVKQWDSDVQVIAVAGELRQVFSNLLSNSLDAIAEKGTIKLRISTGTAWNGQRYVRITIADNGVGICVSSRQNLFQPFFTTKGTVGTGLGLWISKQIVDKHGGTIRMRSLGSGPWKGTAFSVVLPTEPAADNRTHTAGA